METREQGFTGPLQTEQLDDGRNMRLLADFGFVDVRGIEHTAPKDYVYNGGSVPRWLWPLIGSPYTGMARKGYPIHDFARDQIKKEPSYPRRRELALHSDRTLLEICKFVGVRRWRRKLIYLGIRAHSKVVYVWPVSD